jgi:hypothetical protein
MASIKLYDLQPTGSELFADSESYMNELGDSELEIISGGLIPTTPTVSIVVSRVSAASSMRCLNVSIKLTQKPVDGVPGISGAVSAISRAIF